MEFANLLVKFLKERHMSQRTLARKSGVNYVTINRLINGYPSRITSETVEKLAHGLDCNQEERDELLRAAGRAPGDVETKFAESPTSARLFRRVSELDLDEAKTLLKKLEENARKKKKNK